VHLLAGIVVGLLVQAEIADLGGAARQDGSSLGDQILPDLARRWFQVGFDTDRVRTGGVLRVRPFRDLWRWFDCLLGGLFGATPAISNSWASAAVMSSGKSIVRPSSM
jgi:hypothetical protein